MIDPQIPLSVKPMPQLENPMESYGRVLTLKNLAQRGQLQDLEMQKAQQDIQEKQRDQQDQETGRKAYMESGGDMNKFMSLLTQRGVSPKMIISTQKSIADAGEARLKMTKGQQEVADNKNNIYGSTAASLMQIKDPQQRQIYWQQNGIPALVQAGFKAEDLPPNLPTDPAEQDQFLQFHANQANTVTQIADQVRAAEEAKRAAEKWGLEKPGVAARSAIDQNKVDIINNTKPEDMLSLADQMIDPKKYPSLNLRVRSAVLFAAQRKDIDGAKAILMKGMEEAAANERPGVGVPLPADVEAQKIRMRPPRPEPSPVGTLQMVETPDGKPALLNTKTGQVTEAPGVQRVGTAAAKEKINAPIEEAHSYAHSYLDSGKFSGTSDESLMMKFFELEKTSTGFRMTKPQIDMFQESRNFKETAKAKWNHLTKGTWLDDDQRKRVVDTIDALYKAKQSSRSGGAAAPAVGDKRPPLSSFENK